MRDGFGREINYLRISLTDRCNLRCGYCMPLCGTQSIPHNEILTYEEITLIVEAAAALGINKVRLTGGEPLVRRGVTELVKMLRAVFGIKELNLTTNGILLSEYASALKDAGIDRINISLDTLNADTYAKLTGTDGLDAVLAGIDSAIALGIPVKLNCVPVDGINNDDIADIAMYAGERGIDVRYIELMPIGMGSGYKGIRSDDLLHMLEKTYGRAVQEERINNSTAQYYSFEGLRGRVGFISPLTHKFCDSCNRLRLTSDGYLKLCLQYNTGTDLKKPLRAGTGTYELTELIREAVMNKPKEHRFSYEQEGKMPCYAQHEEKTGMSYGGSDSGENTDSRMMYHIGG